MSIPVVVAGVSLAGFVMRSSRELDLFASDLVGKVMRDSNPLGPAGALVSSEDISRSQCQARYRIRMRFFLCLTRYVSWSISARQSNCTALSKALLRIPRKKIRKAVGFRGDEKEESDMKEDVSYSLG